MRPAMDLDLAHGTTLEMVRGRPPRLQPWFTPAWHSAWERAQEIASVWGLAVPGNSCSSLAHWLIIGWQQQPAGCEPRHPISRAQPRPTCTTLVHLGALQPTKCRWILALWPSGQPFKWHVEAEVKGGGTQSSSLDVLGGCPLCPSCGGRGQVKTDTGATAMGSSCGM